MGDIHTLPSRPGCDETSVLLAAGHLLRQAREARQDPRLPRTALAERVGIGHAEIWKQEVGLKWLKVPYLYRLVRALGLSMADLFPPNPDAKLTQLQQRIATLPPAYHDALWDLLDAWALLPKDPTP